MMLMMMMNGTSPLVLILDTHNPQHPGTGNANCCLRRKKTMMLMTGVALEKKIRMSR